MCGGAFPPPPPQCLKENMILKNAILVLCLTVSVGVSSSPMDISSFKPKMLLNDKKELLSPPSSYNYAFVPNNSGYLHEAYNDSYYFMSNASYSEPIFTRSSDGAYYNYTYTGSDGVLPFPITLTYKHSDTPWQSQSGGYKPYFDGVNLANVGSSNAVGSIDSKVYFALNNTTNHDYKFILDLSGTSEGNFYMTIDSIYYGFNSSTSIYTIPSALIYIYIPSYSNVVFSRTSSTSKNVMDSFYLLDLGTDNAYDEGVEIGSSDGQTSFDIASSQWVIDNSNAYDSGYIDGGEVMTDIFSLFSNAIGIVGDVLGISLFGAFTIGGLISIPIVMGLLFWIIEKWRGG